MYGRTIFSIALGLAALAIVCPLHSANALDTGYRTASTTISAGSWTSCTPTTLQSSNDVRANGFDGSTECVIAGFGLSIPTGDTILGVRVEVEYACFLAVTCPSGYGASALVKIANGISTSTEKQTPYTTDSTTDNVAVLGSTSDMWGTSFTASDFASSTFRLIMGADTDSVQLRIDKIRLNVTYGSTTPPTSTSTATNTSTTNSTQQSYGLGVLLFWATFLLTIWSWA